MLVQKGSRRLSYLSEAIAEAAEKGSVKARELKKIQQRPRMSYFVHAHNSQQLSHKMLPQNSTEADTQSDRESENPVSISKLRTEKPTAPKPSANHTEPVPPKPSQIKSITGF
jgi:hypothetical protein